MTASDGPSPDFQYNPPMQTSCLIDGRPGDTVATDDRGLNYGDGLFETLAVRQGVCEFWDRHMKRLVQGCLRLQLAPPDLDTLAAEANELCRDVQRAVLKIVVTRGRGGRGYRMPAVVAPTRIVRLVEWPDHPATYAEHGVDVRLCALRLSSNPALAGMKHLNRLEHVLARNEWDDRTFAEGLLMDATGHLIEGISSNVFVVRNGILSTPRLDQCGVKGILREVVMELAAAADVGCQEVPVHRDDLQTVDEIFLTNSVIGIWPVRAIDQQGFAAPGPVTRELQSQLRQLRQTMS